MASSKSKFTIDSLNNNAHEDLYMMEGERIIGKVHNVNLKLNSKDMAELRNVCRLKNFIVNILNI